MRVLSLLLSVVLATPLLTAAAEPDNDKEDAPVTYKIPFLDKITLDGDAADWKDAGFRIDAFAPADGHIVPTTDFDATARIAWSNDGLLVLVSVVDDDVRAAVVEGPHLVGDDSVELLLSGRTDGTAHYVIAPPFPEGGPPRASHGYHVGVTGVRSGTRLTAAARRTPAGYVIEALIANDDLNTWSHVGEDIRFNIVINDVDGTPARRRRHAPVWLEPQAGILADPVLRLRPDKEASPPLAAAVRIAPVPGRPGHASVTVVADTPAAGRPVEISPGAASLKLSPVRDDKPPRPALAAERIGRVADRWGAAFTFPLPPVGTRPAPVNVYVDSAKIARVTLSASDDQRIRILDGYDLAFKPAHFAGEQFPACDFVAPAAARDLIGPYSFKYTFFGPDQQVVDRPGQPGRYGALVEIVTAAGPKIRPRLVTLFHQSDPPGPSGSPGAPGWQDGQLDARILALPPQLGIDPTVVAAQQKVLGEHARYLLPDVFASDLDTPLLLAALFESKPDGPPLAGRHSIWATNERWWYPIKQRLGRASYSFTADAPRDYDRVAGAPLPVLLCLHGSGERGSDLAAVHTHGPPKLVAAGKELPFLVVAPQCPAGEWWNARQLGDLLDEIATKYRIDTERIYVTGLSMGGYGAWELAAEYPDRFAAIVPVCGAGGPGDAPRLKHLPTWIFHGMKDHEVPFNRGEEMFNALKKSGGRVKFTPYPNLGHDCWTTTYDNPELYEWLLKQKRGAPTEPAFKP